MNQRILVMAYACAPNEGSEPGVGWQWPLALASTGRAVHVLTRSNNREAIEASTAIAAGQGSLQFHYVDLPSWLTNLKARTGYVGMLVYYYLWQWRAGLVARSLSRRMPFDFAHHVTFVLDWMGSGLSITSLPLIWGPIGGSANRWPKGVPLLSRGMKATLHEWVRVLAQQWRYLDPLYHMSVRRSKCVVYYSSLSLAEAPRSLVPKARWIRHIATDIDTTASFRRERHRELRLATGGRLVHWKGYDLVIRALSRVIEAGGDVTLDVTGDGPERGNLEGLVKSLGLDNRVTIHGKLPRVGLLALLSGADAYVSASLRDGPLVGIVEAMARGLPVISVAYGGQSDLVKKAWGFPVAGGSAETLITGLAEAIKEALDSDLGVKSAAAKDFILANYSPEALRKALKDLYGEVSTGIAE